ncbi:hypothetical protein A8709_31995 [Paenibacillus pectinilyticus]|uniref:Thiamine pyrophosphokinase n=1 Tax=Paenibacillus pectinilyticus TaxID=512399 RepID=A0A1C0ZWI0_9BACL|nr:putative cytokinetic ring protein SteA [Paenibacillus pectinilyticus]OCT12450.1 hypothetical protein A8709_31995 [Paenibacillus pectinilyticus]
MNWSSLSLFTTKGNPVCKGKIYIAASEQESFQHLPPNRIVVLPYGDLDEEQAQELLNRKVKGVLHCTRAMSGVYPTQGPLLLLQQHIPIWELDDALHMPVSLQDQEVAIYSSYIQVSGQSVACRLFTREDWLVAQQTANEHASKRWEPFVEDTLTFAMREKQAVMAPMPDIVLRTSFEGRHVVIVASGTGHKKDLLGAKKVISTFNPILIGVGQGADTLLANGYTPDIIVVSDVDYVSSRFLTCGAEIIIHTIPSEPGGNMNPSLDAYAYHMLPCFGNSEDAALLLAYEKGGEWLITVGVDAHLRDFLAKGSKDMGSALLVRMKIGARLVDIKSLCALDVKPSLWAREGISTIVLSCIFVALSMFQLHWVLKRAAHVVWKLVGVE